MSPYPSSSPLASPRSSIRGRSITPDIIEPESFGGGGGFNLADELAMADNSDDEQDQAVEESGYEGVNGYLGVNGRGSALSVRSDYEGSEYGDIDEDSDGYLSDRVDNEKVELQQLVEEVTQGGAAGVVGRFVEELRGMRGQMDVENHARRLITMQRSLASALDGHLRLLRDIPILSPLLLQDTSLLDLLSTLSLPVPVPISELLSDSSLDLTALSDTLAMTRQEQLSITRKLRSVKDSWLERKSEWEVLEERMMWLEEHDSVDVRGRGSCAREVDFMVRGFGKVLGGMEREM